MIFRILLVLFMALFGFYYATVAHHALVRVFYPEQNFFKLLIPFYGWYLLFKNK